MVRIGAILALIGRSLKGIAHVVAVEVVCACVTRRIARVVIIGITFAEGCTVVFDDARAVAGTGDAFAGIDGFHADEWVSGVVFVSFVAQADGFILGVDEAQSVSAAIDVGAWIIGDDARVGVTILVAVITDADGVAFGRQKTCAVVAARHILTGVCLRDAIEDVVLGLMVAFFAHTDGADRRSWDTFTVSATRDAATDFVDIVNREIFLAC